MRGKRERRAVWGGELLGVAGGGLRDGSTQGTLPRAAWGGGWGGGVGLGRRNEDVTY
jgi:hypothetical protein